jgi:hypothetical protein
VGQEGALALCGARPARGLGGRRDGRVLARPVTRVFNSGTTRLPCRDRIGRDATGSVQWYWHFHPDWQVESGKRGRLAHHGRDARLHAAAEPTAGYTARLYRGDEATKLGWYSPRFGHKVPCTTLVVEAKPLPEDIDEAGVVWSFQA